jgi:hypothetical protein
MGTFKRTLHSETFEGNISNVSSLNGKRQNQVRTECSSIEVFDYGKNNLIYVIENKSMQVSNGDLGTIKDDVYFGYLYIALDEEDKLKALSTLKNGTLPDGIIGKDFMSNFNRHEYFKDNNFPVNLSICHYRDSILSSLYHNKICIGVEYYDDFVGEDKLHAYLSEDLPSIIELSLSEFSKIISSEKYRVALLWDKFNIDKKYNRIPLGDTENMLDWSNFGNVMKDGIKRLKLTNIKYSLIDRVNEIKRNINKLKKEKECVRLNAIESAKKWSAINEIEFDSENKLIDKRISLLNSIRIKYFKTHYDTDEYDKVIGEIIDHICKPKDSVDIDFGMNSLKELYKLNCNIKHEFPLIMSPEYGIIDISNVIGVDTNILSPILELPYKTIEQIIRTIYKLD